MSKNSPRWLLALVGLGSIWSGGAAVAADGDLDPSFWGDGKFTMGGAGLRYLTSDLEVAPSGRLVVAGAGPSPGYFFWRSLTDSGRTPAPCLFQPPGGAFGVSGGAQIAFDAQGRLVLAGAVDYPGAGSIPAIARFLYPACTLDTSFDGDGYATYGDLGGDNSGEGASVWAFAIDNDGKYVVAGKIGLAWLVMRVHGTTGALDSSFGESGRLIYHFNDGTNARAEVRDLVTLPNLFGPDQIIAVGFARLGANADFDVAVVMLTGSGGFNAGFGGGDGIVLTDFGTNDSFGTAVARDPVSGRIYVAGESQGGPGIPGGAILALTAAGARDTGFGGGDGIVLLGTQVSPHGLLLDSLGRLVTAGYVSSSSDDFYASRHLPSGAFDATFGGNGVVTVPFDLGGSDDEAANSVVSQNGRIALAGIAYDGLYNTTRAALVRLEVALGFADGSERGTQPGNW